MARRSFLGLGVLTLLVAVAATEACGGTSNGTPGDSTTSEAGTGDETGSTTGGDATAPDDAAADGEVIADGGSNIDPDAGDDDAGTDAGPCNTLANTAPAISSVCVSFAPVLGGGKLVAGTYFLTHVAALATPSFCQTKFVPTGFKETLDLTVSATGVGTAETHTNVGGGGSRHRTSTLTPAPADKSPLEAAPTCPPSAATSAPYASAVNNGKQELVLRLAYGKGEALYRFEKQ
ncbi:MAG: hypothetical protein QOI41_2526 [Myxococcales bacterium]|jgi:hypothetical protein|nr:hypothetical protein [Myxococcales bacterium]